MITYRTFPTTTIDITCCTTLDIGCSRCRKFRNVTILVFQVFNCTCRTGSIKIFFYCAAKKVYVACAAHCGRSGSLAIDSDMLSVTTTVCIILYGCSLVNVNIGIALFCISRTIVFVQLIDMRQRITQSAMVCRGVCIIAATKEQAPTFCLCLFCDTLFVEYVTTIATTKDFPNFCAIVQVYLCILRP